VLADDAYAFMVMWETMALSSFFLSLRAIASRKTGARAIYICLWRTSEQSESALLRRTAGNTGDYTFANMRAQQLTPSGFAAFLLALFGFGPRLASCRCMCGYRAHPAHLRLFRRS